MLKNFGARIIQKIPFHFLFRWWSRYLDRSNMGIVVSLHSVIPARELAIGSHLNNFIEISDAKLEKIIQDLIRLDVEFISLKQLSTYLEKGKTLKKLVVHLSFDDGYLDNFTLAYPILKKYDIPFSVFIASDLIDNEKPFMWWYMIEAIINFKLPVSFDKYLFSITAEEYIRETGSNIFAKFRAFIIEHLDKDKTYFEEKISGYFLQMPAVPLPKMMRWNEINDMLLSGLCEIGVHTVTHPRFKNISNEKRIYEILHCRERIALNTQVLSNYFAFPYGSKEDIGDTAGLQEMFSSCGMELCLTTIPGELNRDTEKLFVPRIFLNETTNMYTLKSRLNGYYQRRNIKITQ